MNFLQILMVKASSTTVVDSDAEFNYGTYSSTQINGSGSAAYLSLAGGSYWWSNNYGYRRALTIDLNGNGSVPSGYTVHLSLTGSTASSIYGSSLSTGNDFRIVYFNGSTNTELDRYVVSYSSSSIDLYFKTQVSISSNNSTSYFAYYGYASAGSPPANTSNIFSNTNIATSGTASASDSYSQNPVSLVNNGTASGTSNAWGNNNAANSRVMISLGSVKQIWKIAMYWGGDNTGGWSKPAGTYFPDTYRAQITTNGTATATDAYTDSKWTSLDATTDKLSIARTNTTDYPSPGYAVSPSISGNIITSSLANCTNCWGTTITNTFSPVSALSFRIALVNAAWIGGFGELYIYPVNDSPLSFEPLVTAGSIDTNLASSGTWTSSSVSNVITLDSPGAWGDMTSGSTAFSANVSNVSDTQTIQFSMRGASTSGGLSLANYQNVGTATSGSTFTKTKADIDALGIVAANAKYIQLQITMTQTSGASPQLDSVSLIYTTDNIAPTTNATAVSMKTSPSGSSVTSNAWTNATTPYFSWTAGADNAGGTGVRGYCLYLGQDSSANPVIAKGLLGTSPLDTGGACQFAIAGTSIDLSTAGLLGTALSTSNTPYYLLAKAIDNANNVYAGSTAEFHFRFDNTPPSNPSFFTAPSQFVATKDVTITWPTSGADASADINSGIAGLQYRIGSGGTWYGDIHNGSQNSTDLLADDGSYETQSIPDFANLSDGNNIIYFRTWDTAGNTSIAYVTTAIRINTSSPSSPQNVTATPSTSTTNSFAFSWLAPASFTGSAGNLTYCYTINTIPSNTSCTFTVAGVTSLSAAAYATQPGDNTFYVVAKDEAGNINYATAANTTFTANTAAPGIPLNLDIADISVKTTSNWKLTISWEAPSDVGAGVSSYKVFRSIDNSTFSQVASTGGASYVDTGLSQQTYYYKIKACDSANNCGAFSSVVSKKPTGKFTSPADLISQPSVTVSTRKATIAWTTDRTSDSRVQFGTASGIYNTTEAASSDQVKSHSIELTNLDAGTTYYYKAKWTDEDGNIGTSTELSFTTLPAPVVKNVILLDVNLSTVTIQFTTVEAASVKVYYGKSEAFGGVETINTSRTESTYTVQLSGLDDGTVYAYKLEPIDLEGNQYANPQVNSFTTPARPRISNLQFQPVSGEPTSTQKISWVTNVPATSELHYGLVGVSKQETIDSKLVTDHQLVIRNLLDSSVYSLFAFSRDSAGNLASSDEQTFKTALDTRPPKVSDYSVETAIVGSGSSAKGQIIVSWKTDEPATSQIAYTEGTADSYANSSTRDVALTLDHVVIVSDLSTSTAYRVKAISQDRSNNQGESDPASAIIGKASDNVLSVMFDIVKKLFGK